LRAQKPPIATDCRHALFVGGEARNFRRRHRCRRHAMAASAIGRANRAILVTAAAAAR
jgi:hypothetical protein